MAYTITIEAETPAELYQRVLELVAGMPRPKNYGKHSESAEKPAKRKGGK